MRRDLDHLPPVKQRELERVVEIIFEEFGDALALSKHEWKRKGRIQKAHHAAFRSKVRQPG